MDYPILTPLQLSTHLRSLRKARGLSQAEGTPTAVSVEQLLELLGALGVRIVLRDPREPQADISAVSASPQSSPRQRKTGGEW